MNLNFFVNYTLSFYVAFSILLFLSVQDTSAGNCTYCRQEIHEACSHCPSCNMPISTPSQTFDSATSLFSTNSEIIPPLGLFSSLYIDDRRQTGQTGQSGQSGQSGQTGQTGQSGQTEWYKTGKALLNFARSSQSKKNWQLVLVHACLTEGENNSYSYLLKVIALRKLGELNNAIELAKNFLESNEENTVVNNYNTILFEAAFISLLLKDYKSSVFYFIKYFSLIKDVLITAKSVNNAYKSAQMVLETNPKDSDARLLLRICYCRFRDKLTKEAIHVLKSSGSMY